VADKSHSAHAVSALAFERTQVSFRLRGKRAVVGPVAETFLKVGSQAKHDKWTDYRIEATDLVSP
jgi:hypothetical protein